MIRLAEQQAIDLLWTGVALPGLEAINTHYGWTRNNQGNFTTIIFSNSVDGKFYVLEVDRVGVGPTTDGDLNLRYTYTFELNCPEVRGEEVIMTRWTLV